MALTYTVYPEADSGGIANSAASSTSRSYTSGDMVTVAYCNEQSNGLNNYSISNTNTAQTWNLIEDVKIGTDCSVYVAQCVMSTTQSMVISVETGADTFNAHLFVIVESGQHATTPVPAGNVFTNYSQTDVSQAITPTATGSNLWLVCADYGQTNTFAAGANCIKIDGVNVSGAYTTCLIRPNTQPRSDASAFTIGETDTGGTVAWVAWEVQAAAGASQSQAPRSMHQFRQRR